MKQRCSSLAFPLFQHSLLLVAILAICSKSATTVYGWTPAQQPAQKGLSSTSTQHLHSTTTTPNLLSTPPTLHRRNAILKSLLLVSLPINRALADDDLTSQLYNPDGSLRDATTITEAPTRTVSIVLADDDESVIVDGKPQATTSTSSATSKTTIQYDLPAKWQSNSGALYTDATTGQSACQHISVYRISTKNNGLQKAAQTGVGRTLQTQDHVGFGDGDSDLMGGRRRRGQKSDEEEYYEFDMARAPRTCATTTTGTDDTLGLGLFCAYQDIFLLAATTTSNNANKDQQQQQAYILCVQADKEQWQRSNAELRRVRSSFRVEESS